MTVNTKLKSIFDFFYPTRCIFCDKLLRKSHVCTECWKKVFWFSDIICQKCGAPQRFKMSDICEKCAVTSYHYDKARSIFAYTEFSKKPILKFKHQDDTHLADIFANWLIKAIENQNIDILLPVPIHSTKLQKRLYNQSALLCNTISELTKIPWSPRVLEKTKITPSQEGLDRKTRLENVRQSFSINQKYAHTIKGKNIALIDDVYTTGATANECSRILKESNVKTVTIVTISKVL